VRFDRVVCFVDGFNLYHAIAKLKRPHLKWVDLRALLRRYVRPESETLAGIYYFSAYANWLPDARRRHRAYVAALASTGVIPVIGKFKAKNRWCPLCRRSSVGHEEKETDVNIALQLLDGGYRDGFDHALLVSRDSDLIPAVRMLRERFPRKRLTVVAPPLRGHSAEMLRWATGKTKIRVEHLERSLLPAEVRDSSGELIATRPEEYAPPKRGL
jgi:uncharacterized LabA/DUF88 family protein